MELLKIDSIEEARQKMLDCACGIIKVEELSPKRCLNRILVADIFAPEDIPGFDRSTVDGYAVVSKDTAAAGESLPVILTAVGEVEMGVAADFAIKSGECAYIPTGGMLPQGADAVVMVEYSEDFGGVGVALYKSAAFGEGVVRRGDDARAGEMLLERGQMLRFCEIGVIAAADLDHVPVYKSPRLAIISTGDEIVRSEEERKPGQVYDVNTPTLKAYAEKNGFIVVRTALLQDDEEALESAIRDAMAVCDIVAISGGSSRGKKDATAEVISKVSSPGVFTRGLALKPGKPTIIGYDTPSDTLLVGLPGHPVSAAIVFESLICEWYRLVTGAKRPLALPARLSTNVPASPGKLTYYPAAVTLTDNEYTATPIFGKSGLITTLSSAEGFFEIPRGKEGLPAGDTVMVHLF